MVCRAVRTQPQSRLPSLCVLEQSPSLSGLACPSAEMWDLPVLLSPWVDFSDLQIILRVSAFCPHMLAFPLGAWAWPSQGQGSRGLPCPAAAPAPEPPPLMAAGGGQEAGVL